MFTGSVLRAWIGLFDPTGKRLWKWVSDQSGAIYVDWDFREKVHAILYIMNQ
jgi:hypothetical protein